MFTLACHGAGVAADAFAVVDQESKGRHRRCGDRVLISVQERITTVVAKAKECN
jgi:hypothetical protein